MRNLNAVVGGGHSDSTSVSEDDSTGVHSWSRTNTRRGNEEPIYNSVPEEHHGGGDGLAHGLDRSDRNHNGVLGTMDPCGISSGISVTSNTSRDDDIMVPKYNRQMCTPLNKKKSMDLAPESSGGCGGLAGNLR